MFAFPTVARQCCTWNLRKSLGLCGLQTSVFKGHSFHIGAVSAAALHEELNGRIRAGGRRASNEFRKYIPLSKRSILLTCLGV